MIHRITSHSQHNLTLTQSHTQTESETTMCQQIALNTYQYYCVHFTLKLTDDIKCNYRTPGPKQNTKIVSLQNSRSIHALILLMLSCGNNIRCVSLISILSDVWRHRPVAKYALKSWLKFSFYANVDDFMSARHRPHHRPHVRNYLMFSLPGGDSVPSSYIFSCSGRRLGVSFFLQT